MHVESVFDPGDGEINEDFYCRNENLFGIFDGATSLTPARYMDNLSGGYLASSIAGRTIGANNDRLVNLAIKANSAIRTAMMENGVDLEHKGGLWCTSAAVVRLFEDYFEWVQIGDCLILLVYDDGRHELLVEDFDHDRETLSLWKTCFRNSSAGILSVLADQIMDIRNKQNVSYGVLNGEEEAVSFLNSGEKSLRGVRHILLFTDGLILPNRDPEKRADFSLFTDLYLEGGLARVRDVVREMEENDTNCREYPRFKTHDDIAAFAITFDNTS